MIMMVPAISEIFWEDLPKQHITGCSEDPEHSIKVKTYLGRVVPLV